jgi:hypothetical protein
MHGVGVYGWYWSVALLWCNSRFLQLQADSWKQIKCPVFYKQIDAIGIPLVA